MKANQKAREKYGVAPVLAVLLMIPIIIMIITFIVFWVQDLFNMMKKFQDLLKGLSGQLDEINIDTRGLEEPNIICRDDFEGDALVWEKIETLGVSSVYFDDNNDMAHYESRTKCVRLETIGPGVGIEKHLAWRPLNEVSIEISFTIESGDTNKYFKIYESGNINEANIRYDVLNKVLYYFDDVSNDWISLGTVTLFNHEHCWHTLKIDLNFDYSDADTDKPYYSIITLDEKEYFGAYKQSLNNYQSSYKTDTIFVEFISETNSAAISYVDNFVFRSI